MRAKPPKSEVSSENMMGEALQKRQERKQKCEAQNAGIFFVLGLRKGKKGIHYKKREEESMNKGEVSVRGEATYNGYRLFEQSR